MEEIHWGAMGRLCVRQGVSPSFIVRLQIAVDTCHNGALKTLCREHTLCVRRSETQCWGRCVPHDGKSGSQVAKQDKNDMLQCCGDFSQGIYLCVCGDFLR